MDYSILPAEIARRKNAYLTLCTSIMAGMALSSVLFRFPVPVAGYLTVTAVLFLLGAFSFGFLRNLSRTKIRLKDRALTWIDPGYSKTYPLDNIRRIGIKRTAKGTIREMHIGLGSGKSLYISALDGFEEFVHALSGMLGSGVSFSEVREPLDFDHPLFYSLLGLPISALGIWVCKTIPSLDGQSMKIVVFGFAVYLLVLGAYFLVSEPLSKRYGNKTALPDIAVGLAMIVSAAVMVLFFGGK